MCVDVASMPPPVPPLAAADVNFVPTGVAEVDLVPLQASRLAGVEAIIVSPPVALDDAALILREPAFVAPAASNASAFITKISKPVQEVLHCPPPPKPRKKTLPEDFIPRRSRRVAKLPPITDHKSAEAVCRQLKFKNGDEDPSENQEVFSEEALAQYAKIFEQTLSQEHVRALAALFGWNAPSEAEVHALDDIVVM
jgi:hypothetical protein